MIFLVDGGVKSVCVCVCVCVCVNVLRTCTKSMNKE